MRLRAAAILTALVLLAPLFPAGVARASGFPYAALDTVLTRHLRDGRVAYGELARNRGPLTRFLAATRDAKPDGWSREDQIAFWVNVYNARVLDGVIRRPGLKSVLDAGKILGVPTLGFFRDKDRSGGRDLSLNDIEHEILRKGFDEPRVHFVLNCASESCPVLPPHTLSGATLDSTLTAATRAFLADRSKNRLADSTLEISSLFKWYRKDFVDSKGDLHGFLGRYWPQPPGIRADAPIRFLDYDWSLNGAWPSDSR